MGARSQQLLRPKKSLGQNFLRDANISRKIIGSLNIQPSDCVLEIGPGEGALTEHLAAAAGKLILVELDDRIVERLRETFGRPVEILHQDILTVDLEELAQRQRTSLRVVGNIPYNITSPILFHILDHRTAVNDATLMMQKEVARRLVASSGGKEYGILSVFCQLYADTRLLFDVSPNAFIPKPKVISSVVRLKPLQEPRYGIEDEEFFRRMVRNVFGKRRKTLRNSLSYFFNESVDVSSTTADLARRPEDLSIQELVELSNELFIHYRHAQKTQSHN